VLLPAREFDPSPATINGLAKDFGLNNVTDFERLKLSRVEGFYAMQATNYRYFAATNLHKQAVVFHAPKRP